MHVLGIAESRKNLTPAARVVGSEKKTDIRRVGRSLVRKCTFAEAGELSTETALTQLHRYIFYEK